MLQIQHICKEYRTGKLVTKALDDFSLNLRDNEFVAILGPSGSGKTTLLNIIGGLDHYDSGELIINGISTKKYKDRDWDSYRNHTIGFVFQSYNLIPHQSLLSNVELALTISGVGRKERKKRALEALEKVGLKEHADKRPNQLSGGQMQRVAIARALVNDPDILLADEPTGALDYVTSLQVMDLLKEVAQDRLVVMVTHNPELAQQYATRIVELRDGHMTSDSNPFEVEEGTFPASSYENMGKSFMSLPTAVSLSFHNLLTKKARTLLTAFAGSIGIIGIALIMSLSAGVNNYIADIEEETLSGYPLTISSSGMDMTSLMAGSGLIGGGDEEEEAEINVTSVITSMLSRVEANDLSALKEYLDSGESGMDSYVNAIEYSYDVTPQIYVEYEDGSFRQVNPDTSFSVLGFGSGSSSSSLLSSFMSTDVFHELPLNEQLYAEEYEVVAGRWPKEYNELVLVLSSNGGLSDFMLYSLGLRNGEELDEMIQQFADSENIETPEDIGSYSYDDMLGLSFRLVCAADYYEYDDQYEVWKDKTDNSAYMEELVKDSEELTIVGVVQPLPGAAISMLSSGVYYPSSLIDHMAETAEDSEIVKDQLENPDRNVITGEPFGEEAEESSFDMDSLFEIDEDALTDAFDFDEDAMAEAFADAIDFSELMDFSELDLSELMDLDSMDLGSMDLGSMDLGSMDFGSMDLGSMGLDSINLADLMDLSSLEDLGIDLSDMDLPSIDLNELMSGIEFDFSGLDLTTLLRELTDGYQSYVQNNSAIDLANMQTYFNEYLQSDLAQSILMNNITQIYNGESAVTVTTDQIGTLVEELVPVYVSYVAGGGDAQDYMAFLNSPGVQAALSSWLVQNIQVDTSLAMDSDQAQALLSELAAGYSTWADQNGAADLNEISQSFTDYLNSEEVTSLILSAIEGAFDMEQVNMQISAELMSYMSSVLSSYTETMMSTLTNALSSQLSSALSSSMSGMTSQMSGQISSAVSSMTSEITDQISSMMAEAMSGMMGEMTDAISESMEEALGDSMSDALSENMEDAFSESMSDTFSDSMDLDEDAFMDAFEFNMDSDDLTELIVSMSTGSSSTYAGNLANFGYVDFDSPYEISIYPIDFPSKDEVVDILDQYNERMEAEGLEDRVITYTDTVGTLMSTVTDIVNMISYVLIAFVAISLVVSSIMIGVITYISVLERQKEIGILRAIGASKGNISQVFNAETGMIGLFAGLLGVGLAEFFTIPGDALIHYLGNERVSMYLNPVYAVALIVLSVVLTLIGGLIPSSKAANSDPVVALRSE